MPKAKAAQPQPDLRFEDAIERLEDIIGRMETERVPLDQLLTDYEEGTALLKLCRSRIDTARQRVETIDKELAGARQDFPADGEEDGADSEKDADDDDEIQLL